MILFSKDKISYVAKFDPALKAMIAHELHRDELGGFISTAPDNIPAIQDTQYDECKF